MATIRAAYKRTFQTRPYETQVIELAIEDDISDKSVVTGAVSRLYRQLEDIGNALMGEALAKPDPAGRK